MKRTVIKAIDSRYKDAGRKKSNDDYLCLTRKTYGLKPTPEKPKKIEWWDFWTGKNRAELKRRNGRLK